MLPYIIAHITCIALVHLFFLDIDMSFTNYKSILQCYLCLFIYLHCLSEVCFITPISSFVVKRFGVILELYLARYIFLILYYNKL